MFQLVLLFLGIFGPLVSFSQGRTLASRPDAIIRVKEDRTTAEIVDITMLDPNFPEVAMSAISVKVGENLGVQARGFPAYVDKLGPNSRDRFVKSRLGVNGLIDRATGTLNLQPLCKAFLGIKAPHTVHAVQVIFEDELPNSKTVKSYANDGVVVDGQFSTNPQGVEYLVTFLKQDPEALFIPNEHRAETKQTSPSAAKEGTQLNLLWPLIVIASICAGALVYFAVVSRVGASAKAAK